VPLPAGSAGLGIFVRGVEFVVGSGYVYGFWVSYGMFFKCICFLDYS
jgi:hypothetical protein